MHIRSRTTQHQYEVSYRQTCYAILIFIIYLASNIYFHDYWIEINIFYILLCGCSMKIHKICCTLPTRDLNYPNMHRPGSPETPTPPTITIIEFPESISNIPIAIPLYHPTPIHPSIAAPHTPSRPPSTPPSTPPNTLPSTSPNTHPSTSPNTHPNTSPSTLPPSSEPLPIARQIPIPTLTQLRDID